MVNIYLFIELIGAASAPDVAERIKGLSLANCKFRFEGNDGHDADVTRCLLMTWWNAFSPTTSSA